MYRGMKVKTLSAEQLPALHTEVLLAGWKTVSLKRNWRLEDDWSVPETRQLAEAFIHRMPLAEATRDLGLVRGVQGLGIAEATEDLKAFFSVAGAPMAGDLQQRLSEGWVEARGSVQPKPCTDILTGLATHEHFNRVLQHLSSSADFDPGAFVIGKFSLPPELHQATLRRTTLAELGRVCQDAFRGTGATLAREDNVILVLMLRSCDNYARMVSCHAGLMGTAYFPWAADEITYERLPVQP